MKHFIVFLALAFTATLSQAQTQFKTDADAIAFAKELAADDAATVDTENCKNCIDVKSKNIRVQFWKQANGYSLASITGNESEVKSIWQKLFAADAGTTLVKNGKEVLSISRTGTKYRIECRQL